jgi:CBS domain containing-hemolysin-like protein
MANVGLSLIMEEFILKYHFLFLVNFSISNGIVAFLLSTALTVFVGEIVPQSICVYCHN